MHRSLRKIFALFFVMSDALEVSLKMLSVAGLHPQQWNKFLKRLLAYFALMVTLCLLGLINAGFIFDSNDFGSLAKRMESLMIVGQALIKQITLFYYRKELANILSKRKYFWEIIASNGVNKTLLLNVFKLFRVFLCMCIVNISSIALKPWMTQSTPRELGFFCWVPNHSIFNFYSIYALQIFFLLYIIFMIVGFDISFASLCAHVILQLKMLNFRLSTVDFNNDKIVYGCIQHHTMLINIVVSMRSIYSLFFASQILLTTLSLCMEIFIATESSMTPFQFIKNTSLTASFAFQLCFFCLPASEVSYQASEITNSIYKSLWYENYKKSKHYLIMIMMRSQKNLEFTAGGMATINREIITQVFKSAASFLTMMKSFKEN